MKRFRPSVESLERRDTPTPAYTNLYSFPGPSVVGEPVRFTAPAWRVPFIAWRAKSATRGRLASTSPRRDAASP